MWRETPRWKLIAGWRGRQTHAADSLQDDYVMSIECNALLGQVSELSEVYVEHPEWLQALPLQGTRVAARDGMAALSALMQFLLCHQNRHSSRLITGINSITSTKHRTAVGKAAFVTASSCTSLFRVSRTSEATKSIR
jgi:hypothetical protein